MKLVTKKLEKELPQLYESEETPIDDHELKVKLFLPGTGWTWFICEYDPERKLCFGYVISGIDHLFNEWGYFSIHELKTVKSPLGLPVERDLHWSPKKFKDLQRGIDY